MVKASKQEKFPWNVVGDERRIAALRAFAVMGTEPEKSFDRIARVASQALDTPIALVTLLDDTQQWVKACVGMDIREMPVEHAFCAYNLQGGDVMKVPDARNDPRFKDHPLVTGPPHIRFYAGAPLMVEDGHTLGSLCVIDRKPRTLSNEEQQTLLDLAEMVVEELLLRRKKLEQEVVLESISDAFYALDNDWQFTYVNREAERVLRRSRKELLGQNVWEAFPEVRDTILDSAYHEAVDEGKRTQFEYYYTPLETWFDVTAYPHRGGLSVYFRDVTERRALDETRRMLAKSVEVSREAVLITEGKPLEEPGPRIMYVNPAFEKMSGYSAEELYGKTPRMLQGTKTDRQVMDSLREALERGDTWSGETFNYRKDGTPYILQWNVAPVHDREGDILYWTSVQRDVTEEREAEAVLKRQRNLLAQTQRLAGGWEFNLETEEIHWTEEVYRIHEVEPGTDIDLEDGINFYAREAQPLIRSAVERCIETGEPYDLELPFVSAKGSRKWVRAVGAVAEERDGKVTKLAGAFQDITERYQAQLALKEQEERLRGIANSVPGVIFQFFTRPDGTRGTRYVSERARDVLGLSPDAPDLLDQFEECIPQAYRAEYHASVERIVRNEEPWELEFPFDRPDGERISLHGESMPIHTDDEIIFNGVILNVTQRRREEQRRKEADERMQLALKETDCILFLGDLATGQITTFGNFEDIFGAAPDDIASLEVFAERAVHPEDAARMKEFVQGMTDGNLEDRVIDYRTHPLRGEVRWIRGEVHRVDEEDGKPRRAIGLARDITRQKKHEQDLIEARREAEEMNRLKSAFLANMSHEIRTPLTSIIGFAELLEDLEMDEVAQEFADSIRRSGHRLLETLTSVLDFSQLEAGAMRLHPVEIDLGDFTSDLVDGLRISAHERGVKLATKLPEEAVDATIDRGAYQRIVNNLVSNAIKFTEAGGQVTVSVAANEERVRLSVEDMSVGMNPEFLPYLFDAFQQESAGLGREFEGSGLGLAITHRLVELMGGEIDVISEKGKGTTFVVDLPREVQPEQDLPAAA